MAAVADRSQISENLSKLSINTVDTQAHNGEVQVNGGMEYGLPLLDVYKLAVGFYKEKEGKAVHFSYEDKLQLVAFTQQVLHGPYSDAVHKLPPLGALDVVGKDRRVAWQKLGNLTIDQARAGFVESLSRKCPLFSAFIEAHRREKKEQERLAIENEKQKLVLEEEQRHREAEEKLQQEQLDKEESIKRQIQQALNEQTYEQFRKYAEQHNPGDPEKQGALIRQLQEQHYIQYMQQLQVVQQHNSNSKVREVEAKATTLENADLTATDAEDENSPCDNEIHHEGHIPAASMWTRSDFEEFKRAVAQAEGDGVVRVAHGETVTVRVPTHKAGTRLFWEFATDHYDIGFGLYFEYGTPTTDMVSVHVCESEDEERDYNDDELYDEAIHTGDLEAGSICVDGISRPLPTEIVPVFRRDSHMEVYAGSHEYPGEGVYLLKFDNSYSVWRSKTLYYRVYYTQ